MIVYVIRALVNLDSLLTVSVITTLVNLDILLIVSVISAPVNLGSLLTVYVIELWLTLAVFLKKPVSVILCAPLLLHETLPGAPTPNIKVPISYFVDSGL